MPDTTTEERYNVQWKKFLKNSFLWILGIPINVLPVLFKQINDINSETFLGLKKLALLTLADFDFSFISVSVLFILCLEGYFTAPEAPAFFRGFRVASFLCLVFVLVVYCVCFFNPNLLSLLITKNAQLLYNEVTIVLTIVFGLIYNYGNSMKKGDSAC